MFRDERNCEVPCWDCTAYSLPKRKISNSVNAVVGISNFILKRHLNLNYFTQVPIQKVIHNSYQATANLKSNSSHLRLGYLGRLDTAKGFNLLLKTLQKLNTKNWEFKVGGEVTGEKIANFNSLYPLSNVHYLGYVKPEVFFAQVDVLIVPSLWEEPLGRIVLEAYGYGVPVIGSNRGGIPEIIDIGKTGFVFDPSQEDSLLKIIERLIDNLILVKEMGKNALQKYQEFTPTRILQAYLDVYQTVLS
jgi:glycosyltransferase involved in cell wall biosynthesis